MGGRKGLWRNKTLLEVSVFISMQMVILQHSEGNGFFSVLCTDALTPMG